MNRKQSAKLRMAQATAAMLNRHQSTWESLPAFTEAVGDLRDLLGQITTALQTQTTRPQVATAEKKQAGSELGELAFEVGAAVHAYAVVQANQELATRMNLPRTAFIHPRDGNFVPRCQAVLEAATEHLAHLAGYGVVAAKVTSLKKRLQAFQTAATRPRETAAARSAATTQLRQLFAGIDTVLNQRLDKLAAQFRESNPEFCNEYSETRWIVHGTRTRNSAGEPAEASGQLTTVRITNTEAQPTDRGVTPLAESASSIKAA